MNSRLSRSHDLTLSQFPFLERCYLEQIPSLLPDGWEIRIPLNAVAIGETNHNRKESILS